VAKSDLVDAPYATEVPLVLECRLLHTLEIGMHTQFVGEIIDVKADPAVLSQDGLPDILKVRPMIFDSAHRGYYGVGPYLGDAFSAGKK
jgi:flavin reductase (DIM6/NTAB) family NADH-FMN oxidoreductase RutF